MKLFNCLIILAFLNLIVIGSEVKSNLQKRSLGRADMIKEENEEFKNFLFKEVNTGWGDLISTKPKVDAFTGAVLNSAEAKIKAASKKVESAAKSIYSKLMKAKKNVTDAVGKTGNFLKSALSGVSKTAGSINENLAKAISTGQLAEEDLTKDINFSDYQYGPLVRKPKIGVIYGPDLTPSWGGSWSADSSRAKSAIAAAERSKQTNAIAKAEGTYGASAAVEASESYQQQAYKAETKSAAAIMQESGMNGGKSLDVNAAGNTPITDLYGNALEKKADALQMSSAQAAAASSQSQSSSASESSFEAESSSQVSASAASASSSGSFGLSAANIGSQGMYAREFDCVKDKITKAIDPRYKIIKLMEKRVNDDNSIRFFCVDTTNDKTVALKLFFKGMPHNCEFYNQLTDREYSDASKDCLNNKIISNRLYGLPKEYSGSYTDYKDKMIYNDVQFPLCMDNNSLKGGNSFFHQVYNLPDGENLKTKCLLENDLDNSNSCIPFLRTIAKGALHGLEILNSGNKFFFHGNLNPKNMYLKMFQSERKVFLDNLKYDSNTFDDINNPPSSFDMDMLGDTLLQLLIGTDRPNAIPLPLKDPFDVYIKVKDYLRTSGIPLNIKSAALNVAPDIDSNNAKVVTRHEFLYKLSKSIFDLIYRLKNTNVQPNMQFKTPSQALKHDFLQSYNPPIVNPDGTVKPDLSARQMEALGASPSDY